MLLQVNLDNQVLELTALLSLLVSYFVIEFWEPSAGIHGIISSLTCSSYIIEFQEPSAGTHVTVFAFTYTITTLYIVCCKYILYPTKFQNSVGSNIDF